MTATSKLSEALRIHFTISLSVWLTLYSHYHWVLKSVTVFLYQFINCTCDEVYNEKLLTLTTPSRRQSETLLTVIELGSKIFRNSVFDCICRHYGDKWQFKTLFLKISDLRWPKVLSFSIAAYPVCLLWWSSLWTTLLPNFSWVSLLQCFQLLAFIFKQSRRREVAQW